MKLGQTEVTQFRLLSRAVDKNVARLDVPVQDPVIMRVLKSRCARRNDSQRLRDGYGAWCRIKEFLGAHVQVLESKVVTASELTPRIDLDDRGVFAQIRDDLGFANE